MRRMLVDDRRMASLRKVAFACAALVLAITTLSAFIRLSAGGLGCEPWPQCYARAARDAQQGNAAPATGAVAAARIAHRITAVAALLLVIYMVMNTWSKAPVLRREGAMVLGLLFLALFLAILGRWTAGSRAPAVVLGNLLAGFVMFALACRLAHEVGRRQAPPAAPGLGAWVWLAAVVLLLQVALGGLVNAGHAGLSCPQLAHCDLAAGSWQSFDLSRPPSFDLSDPTNPGGAWVHALHRAGAAAVLMALLPLGIAAWRRGRRAGAVLVLLLGVQLALGLLLVTLGLPLWTALAHNVIAALMLAVLATLATAGRPAAPAGAIRTG